MQGLKTIQKNNIWNNIYVDSEPSDDGAPYRYRISRDSKEILTIQYQLKHPVDEDSTAGVTDFDLLEIIRHGLIEFQKGPLSCREMEIALTKIEEAIMWMDKRWQDRAERGVLATSEK